jgi:signal transduction histidine kinase
MASLSKTIAGRLTFGVIAIQLVLLPALYFSLVYLIRQNNEDAFLNHVREQARFLADSLELRGGAASDKEIIDLLDSIVLSGHGVFSEFKGEGRYLRSTLVTDDLAKAYVEDLGLQQHDDSTYYFSVPVVLGNNTFNLRLGFDESPYLEQNAAAYRNGLIIVVIYIALLLAILPFIGRRVARPIRALQEVSRHVASGNLDEELTVSTDLVELVELAQDLNLMKSRLTGINEELKVKTREREAAVLQRLSLEQQLRHSQRLETIGTMAGGIAHELNNILVPILLHAELALDDAKCGNCSPDDLETILSAANRAKNIVSQVLTFGRRSGGIARGPVDVASAVGEAAAFLRASKPPGIELDISLQPDCPPILGDEGLVSQLVLNLCNNAIQAIPDGQGQVSILLDSSVADEQLVSRNPALRGVRCVRLSVTDDGYGMDETTRHRIFEPFFTTRSVGAGTGLGLSVVHGIVTDMNGTIEVETETGSGSTFRVFIPAYQATKQTGLNQKTGEEYVQNSVNRR